MNCEMRIQLTVTIRSLMHSDLNQWKTFDLDHILCEDDMNYKRFNTFSLLSLDDLSRAVHTADG